MFYDHFSSVVRILSAMQSDGGVGKMFVGIPRTD